ncbi:MAG: transcriptional regulator [Candidatus Melainabacteria bacterium HGW-Melainabacteria-1]|nr:MAG: transcriptional regulator [Candidatus Melainabacteria bacterium HGW-Melainabacteria-1]PKO71865.1 MAG: transcriptional regulator [Betaproteobacteria bacterium HGW-Betaproteobacteria-14]
MYIPPAFREDRIETLHELIRQHPLGLLTTAGDSGLAATPLPFLVHTDEDKNGTLRAHMARANPHWRDLRGVAGCLVVFMGPQGYVTPSWYPTKQETQKVVPTWNYVTVQAWGKPRLVEDAAWLRRQLDDLTHARERTRPHPWAVSDAPEDYIAAQMKAIVGIEIPIDRLEGKWKLSQNRPEADRAGVIAGLGDPEDPDKNEAMGQLMAERSDSH